MENTATYSEARSEYTKQLATFIVPVLVQWFQQLWSRNAGDHKNCLTMFQSECEEIPRWNQDRIHDETRVLIDRSGCDYMEELMTAVFIAHTKVLTAVRLSRKEKKLSITVPKLDYFIHRVFREAARCFWKAPFLFMETGGVVERQKNVLQMESLATEAITSAVRSLLPVKQILKDYLDEGEDVEEEHIEAPVLDEAVPATEPVTEPVTEPTTEATTEATTEPETEVMTDASILAPVVTQPAPAPVPAPILKIDTEPSVSFAKYNTVFDETKGQPEIQELGLSDDDDFDDDSVFDAPADAIEIDQSSARALSEDDAEDLEPPVAPKPVMRQSAVDEAIELE